MQPSNSPPVLRHPLLTALALSMGSAIALGMARFSYALLLAPMRADLDWSYLLAGAMNTANAFGYLLGALITPVLMRKLGATRSMMTGAWLTALFMLASGFITDTAMLFVQRILSGMSSATVFVAGGVLAARLGSLVPERSGLVLGLYYGGAGTGIVLSSLLLPAVISLAGSHGVSHPWQWAWIALAAACLACQLCMARPVRLIPEAASGPRQQDDARISRFGYGLASYFMFGVGYIGYMTFVLALLKEQSLDAASIKLFYVVLGFAVILSARLWSSMLDHFEGGESMMILNALLCLAVLIPGLSTSVAWVFSSGILFGAVFLSVVASTTALVRHNLPQQAWPKGISAFTIVFAMGQIVGPAVVGAVADQRGGLRHGLFFSAAALLIGSLLAFWQKPIQR